MWLLDCGKEEVFVSLPFMQETTKVCLEKVDDGKRKLVEAVQLLIHSGVMTMLLRSTWLGLAGRAGRPSCRSTPRGTGSTPPATRGRRPSSFELIMISYKPRPYVPHLRNKGFD